MESKTEKTNEQDKKYMAVNGTCITDGSIYVHVDEKIFKKWEKKQKAKNVKMRIPF